MRIKDGLAILELAPNVPNVPGTMYPVLVWDEKNTVLIDTGLPGQEETLLELIKKEGVHPEKIDSIIITHHDMDHIGSLASIVKWIKAKNNGESTVRVLSHEIEKPYIQGEKLPIKFTKEILEEMQKQLAQLPPEQQKQYMSTFSDNKPEVTDMVYHQQELPLCGGMRILHTPGHTPGHICIYLEKYKTLVAGDVLTVSDGRLTGPYVDQTYDMAEAKKSLATLLDLEIEGIICFHGGIAVGDIKNVIGEYI